jgi:ribosome modulation factor
MTEDNRSLDQQVRDLNQASKKDKDTLLCYEMGEQAAYRGDLITNCPFRNVRKRAAWIRGHSDAENQKQYNRASKEGLKKMCTLITNILNKTG